MTKEQSAGPRTLFISGIDGDTRRYRCFHHQEQLTSQGVVAGFRESDDSKLLVDVLDYDLFVLHRTPHSPLIRLVIEIARRRGKPVVFETDDLVFDPEVYDHIGFVDTLTPDQARNYQQDLVRQADTFSSCDCVLTTTQFLAQEAQHRGKPAYVHRNAPSAEMFRISEQAYEAHRHGVGQEDDEHVIVIAFFSGTGSHNRDFQVIAEPLLWVLESYPRVWLHISGHLELPPEFLPFQTRIRRAPYISWRELPHVIAGVDINLVPLERSNPFCQAKSENKFVEAGLVGVPTIASRVETYEYAIDDGEDGLLAASLEDWIKGLRELLDNSTRRREIGEAARRKVYELYMPEERAPELVTTLKEIVREYGGRSVDHRHLLKQYAALCSEYVEGMSADAVTQAAQLTSLREIISQYEDQLTVLENSRNNLEQHLEKVRQGRVMRLLNRVQQMFNRS